MTYPFNVRGGPIASNVTALAYDQLTGVLYIGSPAALNVMYPNGSIARVDGLVGLPYANITALAVQASVLSHLGFCVPVALVLLGSVCRVLPVVWFFWPTLSPIHPYPLHLFNLSPSPSIPA